MAGISWRFVALLAVLAMIFSLLMGKLAGISLILMMTRTVIAGLSFAIIAVFVNMGFFRFFPEMYSDNDAFVEKEDPKDSEEDTSNLGRHVDMVTPDEKINLSSLSGPSDSESTYESPPIVESSGKEESSPKKDFDHETGAMAQAIKTVINRD